MSWPNVATVLILVSGAVLSAALKVEGLAMVLAGAAAGFITSGTTKSLPPSTTKRRNTLPPGTP